MQALASFLAVVNQAIKAKKSFVVVPRTQVVYKVALVLTEGGYFSSMSVLPKKLKVFFRYSSGPTTSFRKLVLVSKSSKAVYYCARVKVPGVFLLSNSDSAFILKRDGDFIGGKILFKIV